MSRRLDWLMWFAAFQDYRSNPWLLHLAGKMLDNDPVVDSLLGRVKFRSHFPGKGYLVISQTPGFDQLLAGFAFNLQNL